MRVLKNIAAQFPIYLLWLLVSILVWGFVFSRLTDTTPDRKIVMYVNAVECSDRELSAVLQREAPDPIRLVQVHPVTYVMINERALETADLFILRESDVGKLTEILAPLPASLQPADQDDGLRVEGTLYGLRIWNAASGSGAAEAYITYFNDEVPPVDYFLCFGNRSVHLGEENGTADDAAITVARQLLQLN